MDAQIIVAVVSGAFTLIGVVMTVRSSNAKISNDLDRNDAVQNEKIDSLTKGVTQLACSIEKINLELPELKKDFYLLDHRVKSVEKEIEEMEKEIMKGRRND